MASSPRAGQRAKPRAVPNELEALLKAAKGIGLLSLSQASTMRNNVATGKLSAGVVTADLQKKLAAAKEKWEREKVDARTWAKGRWARAIFDFRPTEEVGDTRVPDLAFSKEDIIQLTLGDPMKWWRGTLASSPSREEGEFPKNYVELLEKKEATRDHYPAEGSVELSVYTGDTLVIVRRGEQTSYGFTERRAGEVKAFPTHCLLPVPIELAQPSKDSDAPPILPRDTGVALEANPAHVTIDVSDEDDASAPPTPEPDNSQSVADAARLERIGLMTQHPPPLSPAASKQLAAGGIVEAIFEEDGPLGLELESTDGAHGRVGLVGITPGSQAARCLGDDLVSALQRCELRLKSMRVGNMPALELSQVPYLKCINLIGSTKARPLAFEFWIDSASDEHSEEEEDPEAQTSRSAAPIAPLGGKVGLKRFMDAGATVVAKLRAEEQALLRELEELDVIEEQKEKAPPEIPVWPPLEQKYSKCLGWLVLIAFALTCAACDLGYHYLYLSLSTADDRAAYRHAGIGSNETDLYGWARVQRSFSHFGEFWDMREPCGGNWTTLMNPTGGTMLEEPLAGLNRVFTCDGDTSLVNLTQGFCVGVVFSLLGLCCKYVTRSKWDCCKRDKPKANSPCALFVERGAVVMLGEALNINHEFVAAGRAKDPSTIDLWLVSFGLLAGALLCTVSSDTCCSWFTCCFTTRRLKARLAAKEAQCSLQTKEIKRLRAQLASVRAKLEVRETYLWARTAEDDRPVPLARDDDDGSTVLGGGEFYVLPDVTDPVGVLRVRFDGRVHGFEVLRGGAIAGVAAGSAAEEAGVTSEHVITEINGEPVEDNMDVRLVSHFLAARPVYVTFAEKGLAAISESEYEPSEAAESYAELLAEYLQEPEPAAVSEF